MSSKRKSIDPDVLLEAVKRVKIGNESKHSVSKNLNIPRTALLRHLGSIDRFIPDIRGATDEDLLKVLDFSSTIGSTPVCNVVDNCSSIGAGSIFTKYEESILMEYILKCAEFYYGLSITEVKKLAFQFAVKTGINFPPAWNEKQMAGWKWFHSFMKRHANMSIRTPQQVSLNRMRGFSRENVDLFYSNLDRVTDPSKDGHEYAAKDIWNMDETGFSTVPTRIGKIVGRKAAKHVGMMASAERGTLVSMVACVSASGTYCPPFWIFPRKNMRSIFLERAPEGSEGVANGSGWIHQNEFVEFMKHFIKFSCASLEHRQLLILDNHGSHLSVEAIDLAKNSGITMISIPPHCSHRLQPLDVSVFGPFKAYYSNACGNWTKNNIGRVMEIHHMPEIVGQCIDLAFTPSNIKSGFRATGIRPFNRDIFTDSDFVVSDFVAGSGSSDSNQNGDMKDQRIITFNDPPGAEEEVATTEPSTSMVVMSRPSTSTAAISEPSTASLIAAVEAAGPLQRMKPKPKTNRGRKPMKSSILTLPEQILHLRERANKRDQSSSSQKKVRTTSLKSSAASAQKKWPAAKKKVEASSSSSSDVDFCIICMRNMPHKLNKTNSINCNVCDRPVHRDCAKLRYGIFICVNCDSADEVENEEEEEV